MSKSEYVVKYSDQLYLYLKTYSEVWENCQWAGPNEAITWPTLTQAQTVSSAVGHGTVGTTKPQ